MLRVVRRPRPLPVVWTVRTGADVLAITNLCRRARSARRHMAPCSWARDMRANGIGIEFGEEYLGGILHQAVGTPENDGVAVTGRHSHRGQPGNILKKPEHFLLLLETRDVDDLDVPRWRGHGGYPHSCDVAATPSSALVTYAARRVRKVWPSASLPRSYALFQQLSRARQAGIEDAPLRSPDFQRVPGRRRGVHRQGHHRRFTDGSNRPATAIAPGRPPRRCCRRKRRP